MKTRITSAFLLASMLTTLAACGEGGGVDTTAADASGDATTAPVETVDPAKTLDLPDTDWEGREFRVLGYENSMRTQFSTFEVDTESENGDVVNDAIFKRNTAIEDKYNVVIKETRYESTDGNTTTAPEIRRSTLAGESDYDLAFINLGAVGTVAREGLFTDLNQVGNVDFSKDWWNQDTNDTLQIGESLYFTASDFSLRDKSRAYIMLINNDMVDEFKLGDPVQMVRDGKWTIDIVNEWCKTVSGDANGNSELDAEDRFGIATDSYNGFTALLFGLDNLTLRRGSSGDLELSINNEHTISSVEKVFSITSDDYFMMYPERWNGKVDYDYWSVSGNTFNAGRALLATTFPHSLQSKSANCQCEYGIIPFPKYDEAQESYYTLADTFAMVFGIPTTAKDYDFSGFMLEALSAYSTDTTLNAYYEVSCKTKYTYDPDSAEMLDLTFDGIRYDLANIYQISGLSQFFYSLAQKDASSFSSSYASIEAKAQESLADLAADLAGE